MSAMDEEKRFSDVLAHRTLVVAELLALAGTWLGVAGIVRGAVIGFEIDLIVSGVLCTSAACLTLLLFRKVATQPVAITSTIFFAVYLCAGAIITVAGNGQHLNFFNYLVWFFPLLIFNKIVNAPKAGRLLFRVLLFAPLVVSAILAQTMLQVFRIELLFVVVAYCISYVCFALMLNTVTRYREEYIVERERAQSMRMESDVLESISDCFISIDFEMKLLYSNEAACAEFGLAREAAPGVAIPAAAPGFFTDSVMAGILTAMGRSFASVFEAQNDSRDRWYEIRCFPRAGGLSIYFRNITESMSSRRKLEEAQANLRDQAALLDKAQDAIIVRDMAGCVIYWNDGAKRLYGWTVAEVMGRPIREIFPDAVTDFDSSVVATLETGEWVGEMSQRRRDGSQLIVESRCTLVTGDDGMPRSILAIETDITDRKLAEAEINHLAFYDGLTGLPNRLLLRKQLDAALATAVRGRTRGALLFIDLDDFKNLNDTLGHNVGDVLLREVAVRLQSAVRAGDTVARLGGDEFVVMLEGLNADAATTAEQAKHVGQTIVQAFLRPYDVGDYECISTVSIGITLFPESSDTVDDLLKRADLAMYRAKSQGRNSVCFFDRAMQTHVASRVALQSDLRRALRDKEFALYYQPQVAGDGRVIGAEALLRWHHPTLGFVPPNEFISLAEEAGLIVELGRWVLQTACAQLAEWAKRPSLDGLTIAVNVSLRQLMDPNFVNLVLEVLAASGANPRRLKLEITESSVMEDPDATIAKMIALKGHSVGFSLDDFGTGYSSLSHLKRLPLDQLKIDRSFVSDVLRNVADASIAHTIVTLGRNLNLAVIAEGVETDGQRDFLARAGCHAYQGYLFSPAVTASSFEAFVAAAAHEKLNVDAA